MALDREKDHTSRFWSKIGLVAEVAQTLREKPVGRETFDEVLDMIHRTISFDSCTMYLYDRKKDSLEEVATRGETVNMIDFLKIGKGYGLAGLAAKEKRAINIPGRGPEKGNAREHHDSLLLLPLLVAGEMVGVICFSHRDPAGFITERQQLLELVADQITISIERIMHQRELDALQRQLHEAKIAMDIARSSAIAPQKLNAIIDLAASVTREINNPLSAIVGNAQIIELESPAVPDTVHDHICSIVDAARRITLITHKLLKIDQMVYGDTHLEDATTGSNSDNSAGDI